MTGFSAFCKREPVLVIAAAAALVSCCLVPPDAAYGGYIDFRTLALLYALMTVVAGLRGAGVFSAMARGLCARAGSARSLGTLLVGLCFFSSMLITNDVALLTFVPFAIVVLRMADRDADLIPVIVLQTVAANLGSILTPVGNPQNLYLYAHYEMSLKDFLGTLAPVWGLSLALLLGGCLLLPGTPLRLRLEPAEPICRRDLTVYLALFALCLLVVVRVLTWPSMLAVLVPVLLVYDRKTLLQADFMLLLTFVAFFVFAGNLARIDGVDRLLRELLAGREYLTALLASQVISNVPAALLLSGFTENAGALLLGVDIGGLGTPIASLASLISMKLYYNLEEARRGRYLLVFTAVNVLLLAVLSCFQALL